MARYDAISFQNSTKELSFTLFFYLAVWKLNEITHRGPYDWKKYKFLCFNCLLDASAAHKLLLFLEFPGLRKFVFLTRFFIKFLENLPNLVFLWEQKLWRPNKLGGRIQPLPPPPVWNRVNCFSGYFTRDHEMDCWLAIEFTSSVKSKSLVFLCHVKYQVETFRKHFQALIEKISKKWVSLLKRAQDSEIRSNSACWHRN